MHDAIQECALRRRLVHLGFACDEDQCIFWAALGNQGEQQCALQYFKLLEGDDSELALWLLSLKDRQLLELILSTEHH